jgi:hypothetical protein
MLKYLVGIHREFSRAYNVVYKLFRRHGRLKYSVSTFEVIVICQGG